ncbi:MAG: TraR/DksA family transcriptional regulator [Alphaproteobacteria bacterium]
MSESERDDTDIGDIKARLMARRAELVDGSKTSAESRRPVELDPSRLGRLSRMDALQEQAMAVEAERRRGLEIKRIDAALTRIDEGEYGYCVTCGDAIAAKRLALDPAAAVCVACAHGGC